MDACKSASAVNWPLNPLLTLIREQIGDELSKIAESGEETVPAFDLLLQVLLVVCSYKPQTVWLCSNRDIYCQRTDCQK